MFPIEKKFTVFSSPHLFTRTRDFAAGDFWKAHWAYEVILFGYLSSSETANPLEWNQRCLLNDISATRILWLKKEELFNYFGNNQPRKYWSHWVLGILIDVPLWQNGQGTS